ncbi:MAG TPA: proteasome activator [Actinomycetota bacterium]|nr:proteasome activator [Actinomycetota bacterium]
MSDQPQQQPQIITPAQAGGVPGEEGEGVIAHPAKLLRIASMIRELVEEVRGVKIDDPGRQRLAEIYRSSVDQLKEALSPDLQKELETLLGPLREPASESEVRVAQAQLLGWLEGLFHGIQAALWAQHMQAQAALQEVRRRQIGPGQLPGQPPQEPQGPPGQYL